MQREFTFWDRVGAGASALCAVHCILTAFALGLLTTAGFGFLASTTAELVFLGVALLIGVIALIHGVRRHGSYVPSLFFIAGLLSISLSHFELGHRHDHEPTPWPGLLGAVGAVCLVLFHLANLRLQHTRRCCHDPHCRHGD
ncbi:MAG TPA: MerC domain-containing protein [Fimbriimonadaceae bacterium]|nr:MerC domain-containing protein [Fimbriimonadaceae bacterium]